LDKRTILAFALIFIIYWVSSQYIWKPKPVEPTILVEEVDVFVPETELESRVQERVRNLEEEEIVAINEAIILENDKMAVSFTNRGALINQVILKEFYYDDKFTNINLIPENRELLQINFGNQVLWDVNNVSFNYELRENELHFYKLDNSGIEISKIFRLLEDYVIDLSIIANNLPYINDYNISVLSGINITEKNKAAMKDIGNSFKFVAQIDREVKSISMSKLNRGEQSFNGMINWAAIRSKYFTISLVPENRIMTQSVRTQRIGDTLGFDLYVRYNNRITDMQDNYQIYIGPVDYDYLVLMGNGMEHITELGARWLRPLAKIFMIYIGFLHRFINNYGLVIILFALTLKIILTPLTNKGLRATKKMQLLQPLQREIQAKFKHDIKRQQQELQKLYKEHKVSPLGGCLPLLLQMPIFFALYPILRYSIDFRQAHFFGWLVDLSEPDPYWILPILMGIFMFIQQKMMQPKSDATSVLDEKQAAMVQSQKMMMYIMPPFLVFIFSSLPAGLVLYWTTFNVFSIIQQYHLNKTEQGVK